MAIVSTSLWTIRNKHKTVKETVINIVNDPNTYKKARMSESDHDSYDENY